MPSDSEYQICGIPRCSTDIFIGCLHCASFLCYDHMNTSCLDHTRQTADTALAPRTCSDSSDMEVSNSVQPKCGKRKRSRRITGMRHYKGNHDNWQKNRRKRARLAGKEYTSTTGKTMPEKMSKTCVCNHGRQHVFKCDLFSDDCRKDILSKYYGTANFGRQRDFILNHTSSRVIASSKRKHKALQYSLPLAGAKMRVCKKMFLSTLDISEKLVTYTLDNCERDGGSRAFSKTDQRGKHTPANKTPVQLLEAV